MKHHDAKVELAAQCGCGARFTGSAEALAAAVHHSIQTGHILEILGSIQPE